jgi:RNA polymerase sigma-70 factor (ECF subfamily)
MSERRERFHRIYDANYERILGYALRRTATVEDAYDVVSETFLIAWRRLDDVPDGERARLWLYGTARNVLTNQHRSQRRQRRLTGRLGEHLSQEPDASCALDANCTLDAAVVVAFSRLRSGDREVLLLAGWEDLDAGQIAEALGCKPPTARVRLHRARRRFATELEKEGVKPRSWTGHEPRRWATARPDTEEAL